MTLILNSNFSSTPTTTLTGDDLVAVGSGKAFVKIAGTYNGNNFVVDEVLDIAQYNSSNQSYKLQKTDGSGEFYWRVLGDSSWGIIATLDTWSIVSGTLSQTELASGNIAGSNSTRVEISQSVNNFYEDEEYTISSTSTGYTVTFDQDVTKNGGATKATFVNQTTGFIFFTGTTIPTSVNLIAPISKTINSFQITQNLNTMAITQDGTHKFGIEYGLVTIDAKTYVVEALSFNKTASRVDIDDSNGEPLGSTIIPGRTEGSATLQLEGTDTAPARGQEIALSSGDNDGTYVIQDVSETQSQGDYSKVAINFYKKIN